MQILTTFTRSLSRAWTLAVLAIHFRSLSMALWVREYEEAEIARD